MNDLKKQDLSYFENKIISEFILDDMGINLKNLGEKKFEKIIPVSLENIDFLGDNQLITEIPEIINFLNHKQEEYKQADYYSRPVWFRINVIDQAFNEYLGLGFLKIDDGWLRFVIYSLGLDKADQSGDGIFTIFDKNFKWAVNFELSQDDSCLTVQKFEK